MLISSKGRYGARAMLALAAHYDQGPMPANQIAAEQRISKKYLENLLASLKAAGLVIAGRGAKGGYSLARPPREITVYDVLLPLEDLSGVTIHCKGKQRGCDLHDECVTRLVWEDLKKSAETILKQRTLQNLLETREELSTQKNGYEKKNPDRKSSTSYRSEQDAFI